MLRKSQSFNSRNSKPRQWISSAPKLSKLWPNTRLNISDAATSYRAPVALASYVGRRRERKTRGRSNIYLYVIVNARIYMLRCYAKNVKADLTASEMKELRAQLTPLI